MFDISVFYTGRLLPRRSFTAHVCEVCICVLGGGRLAVVFDPSDGGFAEETVLVVHQMLVDTGSIQKEHRGGEITLIIM